MSEAMLYFDDKCFEAVIEALLRLPEPLRPNRFRRDEGVPKPNDVITDVPRFRTFLDKGLNGAFLYAERIIYGFFNAGPGEFYLYVTDLDAQNASILMHDLGGLGVSFGYAAEIAERCHRNRLVKKASYGTEEAWVGRNWHRYIPGLYWLTVIPESLAKQHEVPLETLKRAALAVEEPTPGVWLLKFYESSEHWLAHSGQLDRLCEEIPGIFAISCVRPAFEEAKTFLETAEVLHAWR
jgi:hypothetical protein